MEDLKVLLAMIFLGGATLLTPTPITLDQAWVEIYPKKPLKAVTGGASLNVEIAKVDGFPWNAKELVESLPPETIEAELVKEDNQPLVLTHRWGARATKEGTVSVELRADGPVPTGVKFVKVRIKSKIALRGTKVIWQNFSL